MYKSTPSTKRLVELVIDRCEQVVPIRVLDLCCGSGWVARKLKEIFPKAEVWASDIDREIWVDVDNNINWHRGDLFGSLEGQFDLIVCNPPYLELVQWERAGCPEPKIAYTDETFLPRFLEEFKNYLSEFGVVFMEINPNWVRLLEDWEIVQDQSIARFAIFKQNKVNE